MAVNLVLVLTLLLVRYSVGSSQVCSLKRYCSDNCECKNFTSFKNLSFSNCHDDESYLLAARCSYNLDFLSTKTQLVLNQDFDWNGLMQLNKYTSQTYQSPFMIVFYNLAGIDINSKYEPSQDDYLKMESLGLEYSVFNLLGYGRCEDFKSKGSLASLLNDLTDSLVLTRVKFSTDLCPEMFRNLNIQSVTIRDSYVWKIRPRRNSSDNLNISISYFSIYQPRTIKLSIDRTLLHDDLFTDITNIRLESISLNSIYPVDLFKSLTKLKYIGLGLLNTKSFFHHTGGVEWIKYLNYNIRAPRLSLNNTSYLTIEESDYIQKEQFILWLFSYYSPGYEEYFDRYFPFMVYNFPDEDYCLFRHFPHSQLVILRIDANTNDMNSTLSCTIVSLLQYIAYYYQPNNLMRFISSMEGFDARFEECGLDERNKRCDIVPFVTSDHDSYFDSYDLKEGLDKAETILPIYSGPVISFIGVVANILIICAIAHNKLKYKNKQTITVMNKINSKQLVFLLDEPLYKYMLINAVLNELYCLIFLVDLSVECVPTLYYDYKIDDFKKFTHKNCLIKDIVIYYLASILKLTSNVMILGISINRYILLGKDHAMFMIKLAGLSIKKVFLVSLFASSFLSIIIIFQHLNFAFKSMKDENLLVSEYYKYDISKSWFSDRPKVDSYFKGISDTVYLSIVYYFVAYVLFCFLCLVMDILTVKKLRQVLREHADMSKSDEEAKKTTTAEIKSFYMIITFNFINFFFRLPDLFTTVFIVVNLNTPYILHHLCFSFNQCLVLEQVSNLSYIFSLSINLFLYRFFYSTFKDCLADFFDTLVILFNVVFDQTPI